MKEPNKIMQELSDESVYELSLEEWLKFLEQLRDEVDMLIEITKADIHDLS